jgi:tRNA pseudouridine55 synthase
LAKGSYFAKHKESIAGTEKEHEFKKLPFVQVSDAVRKTYEEGKVLLIDKPLHWTSFDAVRKIRNTLKIKKVGHAGTLDPLASGLLIICTGKFTKKINEYMAQPKEYTGTFTLGATTPTYDSESNPENFRDYSHITEAQIIEATKQFIGEIQQFPPIYSAIKKDGEALYELARRGEEVELKARIIHIYEFDITNIELPTVSFRVLCGTGTYIRSLANDIGVALSSGAYLSELRRTKIGDHNVSNAQTMEGILDELSQQSTNGDMM